MGIPAAAQYSVRVHGQYFQRMTVPWSAALLHHSFPSLAVRRKSSGPIEHQDLLVILQTPMPKSAANRCDFRYAQILQLPLAAQPV
jgi:hypothetical protein